MPLRVKAYCERVLRRRRHRMYCAYIVSSNHDGLRVRGHLPIAIDFETDPIDVQLRPAPVDFTLASLRMCESCGRVDGDIECRSTILVTQRGRASARRRYDQQQRGNQNAADRAEQLLHPSPCSVLSGETGCFPVAPSTPRDAPMGIDISALRRHNDSGVIRVQSLFAN
jgi:hypothetical protein